MNDQSEEYNPRGRGATFSASELNYNLPHYDNEDTPSMPIEEGEFNYNLPHYDNEDTTSISSEEVEDSSAGSAELNIDAIDVSRFTNVPYRAPQSYGNRREGTYSPETSRDVANHRANLSSLFRRYMGHGAISTTQSDIARRSGNTSYAIFNRAFKRRHESEPSSTATIPSNHNDIYKMFVSGGTLVVPRNWGRPSSLDMNTNEHSATYCDGVTIDAFISHFRNKVLELKYRPNLTDFDKIYKSFCKYAVTRLIYIKLRMNLNNNEENNENDDEDDDEENNEDDDENDDKMNNEYDDEYDDEENNEDDDEDDDDKNNEDDDEDDDEEINEDDDEDDDEANNEDDDEYDDEENIEDDDEDDDKMNNEDDDEYDDEENNEDDDENDDEENNEDDDEDDDEANNEDDDKGHDEENNEDDDEDDDKENNEDDEDNENDSEVENFHNIDDAYETDTYIDTYADRYANSENDIADMEAQGGQIGGTETVEITEKVSLEEKTKRNAIRSFLRRNLCVSTRSKTESDTDSE
ncbi:unnamed protein product [Owenia fusiformis]|uniref:Uncharacterized protein n=1 Tax=Owenia fusiformis TaxID=6347 RepID=A0A8S4MW00_OWEFU|nr:unnamed protein product [Owenia fusiformis]